MVVRVSRGVTLAEIDDGNRQLALTRKSSFHLLQSLKFPS